MILATLEYNKSRKQWQCRIEISWQSRLWIYSYSNVSPYKIRDQVRSIHNISYENWKKLKKSGIVYKQYIHTINEY